MVSAPLRGYMTELDQPSGHIIWGVGPAASSSANPGSEQTDRRKKITNRKLVLSGGKIPANVEILTPSEDLTSHSDSIGEAGTGTSSTVGHSENEPVDKRKKLKNRKLVQKSNDMQANGEVLTPSEDLTSQNGSIDENIEHRGSKSLESQNVSGATHVVFNTSSESAVDSSDHSSDKVNPSGEKQKNRRKGSANSVQDNQVDLPSLGSKLHEKNQCRPCLFFFSDVGCHNAYNCEFCHLPHTSKGQPRAGKGKRERYRKLINRLSQERVNPEMQACENELQHDDGPLLVTL